MNIRIRGPAGTTTLQLEPGQTLHDLRIKVEGSTGIAPSRQELRLGFPPKPLPAATADTATLSSLGITNGESMIVSEVEAQARPPPLAPSPPTTRVPGVFPPPATPLARASPAPIAQKAWKPLEIAFEEVDGGFLVQRVVPDDNSCLFSAIGLVLEPGRKDAVPYLRKLVADTIEADPETWSEPILGQSRESYVSAILGPNTWGGAIELSIFAANAKTEICSIDVQSGRVDWFGQGKGYDTRVILIYSGIHYDAVTFSWTHPTPSPTFPPLEIEFDTTIFPASSSDTMLAAALQMATKLRATHSYTDAATFTLKCEVCGKAIVGEKEARAHASETSHTSFGEYDG